MTSQISDIVVPRVFTPYMAENKPAKLVLLEKSGILAPPAPDIAKRFKAGGNQIEVPYWEDLDDAEKAPIMKMIIGWRRVLSRAWSVRLMLLAALLSGAEVALPFMGEIIEPGCLALLSALSSSGAFVARLLTQKDIKHGT